MTCLSETLKSLSPCPGFPGSQNGPVICLTCLHLFSFRFILLLPHLCPCPSLSTKHYLPQGLCACSSIFQGLLLISMRFPSSNSFRLLRPCGRPSISALILTFVFPRELMFEDAHLGHWTLGVSWDVVIQHWKTKLAPSLSWIGSFFFFFFDPGIRKLETNWSIPVFLSYW